MKRLGFIFFLLITAIVESVIQIHLSLIAILILANFVKYRNLFWWVFVAGLVLDLLSGNFLGLNFLAIIVTLTIFDFFKKFFWPNLTYEIFPRQVIVATILEVVAALRFFDIFYNLVNFGVVSFNFDFRIILAEIVVTLILFPAISYLSLRFITPKQMELRF